MVDLIVAVYVIITALVAAASLVTTAVRRQMSIEERIMMYSLARESLEVMRGLRDNAFTGTRPTNCTTCVTLPSGQSGGDHNGITAFNPTSGQWVFDYGGSDNKFDKVNGNEICQDGATGAYYQRNSACDAGDSHTFKNYRRRVTVDFICLNPSNNTECIANSGAGCPGNCAAGYSQFIGHRVIARVWMPDRGCGTTSSVWGCVNLEDYLYAWK